MRYLYIIIGCALCGLSYTLFLIPHQVVPGGIAGIAMILHFLYRTPVGVVTIVLNIPLFIVALRILGFGYGLKSVIAILLTNIMVDLSIYTLKIQSPTGNAILASLYGGILLGLGLGFVFRGGASTGGSDIIGQIINRYTNLSTGMGIMLVDVVVITLAGITTRSLDLALLGYLALFISSRVIDLVLEGIDYARAALVITSENERVINAIYEKMQRGVTILDGFSPYTKEKRPVIFCVITKKETLLFTSLVRGIDRKAFIILTDVYEILGEGFRRRV